MSEAIDWKSRYRDFLHESEAKEHHLRAHAQALRRLLLRLCELSAGRDPLLDTQLDGIAAAARENAGIAALDALADVLADYALQPEHEPGRWNESIAAMDQLLRSLSPADSGSPLAEDLLRSLPGVATDNAFAQVVLGTLDIVREQSERLTHDHMETSSLLEQVTGKLDDVASFLAGASDERRTSLDDAETLNVRVLAEVQDLSDQVREASDISPLKSLIGARVETISAQVRDFREREEQRLTEYNSRNDAMRQRVIDLELQAHKLRQDLEEERQRARLDPLTGLANRASFDERFSEAMERHKRFGTPVSLLLWDIDRFKNINDTCGHRAGDRVLREVARCFTSRLRTTDFVARIGGEEFVALLVGTPADQALRVAEDLRSGVSGLKLHFRGTPVPVTASCGITEFIVGDSTTSAFDRADAALYRAKDGGRNLCVAAA